MDEYENRMMNYYEEDNEDNRARETWIFTFGTDHTNPITGKSLFKNYVEIPGTWDEAREKMLNRFGNRFSMQYQNKEKAGVERFGLVELKLEF